jgi:hypothetical protein
MGFGLLCLSAAAKLIWMNLRARSLLILAGSLWLEPAVMAAETAKLFPPLVYAAEGVGKIIRYDSTGTAAWEFPAEMARDVWVLPNQNILFCYNRDYDSAKHDNLSGVMEVTTAKKIVFSFRTVGQVWSCQRLADGNTLVGAASQGKLLVVSPEREIIKTVRLLSPPGHSCLRNARQIAGGHFLVAEESAHAAREYSGEGKLLREIKLSFAPFSVIRLENGNTVISGQQTIVEVDQADKIVWSVKGDDLPQAGIRWFAGLQVLPQGNLFVCNAGGKVPFLEISRDKQIAWQSPSAIAVPLGHGIQRLDLVGTPQK